LSATPIDIVTSFVAAWNRKDRRAVREAMRDDVVCHGIPLPPAIGIDETMTMLDTFFAAKEIDWSIVHIAASDRTVLTERIDRFRYPGTDWVQVRAMGIFEIDPEGRISAWRDYFDLGELEQALPKTNQG
jgi:limonene-1,2-epoxide hydrolase